MLVERELAIRSFVPEDYHRGAGDLLRSEAGRPDLQGHVVPGGVEPLDAATSLPADGEEAKTDLRRGRGRARRPSSRSRRKTQRMAPPLLYDLTELQRHANRLYGFSAQRTLELAQALYERHKLISYPRTDSRHLSQDVARDPAEDRAGDRGRRIESCSRPAPESARSASASSTTRRSAITTRSSRPTSRRDRPTSAGRAQDLRPDLPAAAQRVARRPYLVGHDGHHRHPQRRDRRPLPHQRAARCSRSVGRCSTSRRPRSRKRQMRKPNAAAGPGEGPAAGRRRRRVRRKKTRAPKRFTEARCSPRWKRPARRSTRKSSRTR